MDLDELPPQLRPVLQALTAALRTREPAIRHRVERLREAHPGLSPDELASELVSSYRKRVAATGAAGGAAAVVPGLGTLVAVGTVTSQSLYALEQETELVLAIARIYAHELEGSDRRILEALVVVGIAGGAVKLRDEVLVAGGQRVTVAAFRRVPEAFLSRTGGHLFARILTRVAGARAAASVARLAPLAVGMAVGAGFDWLAVTALGKAAIRYYGPGGPAYRYPALAAPEDGREVEPGG